ncbi:MAG: pyridoxal-phosphate dependent enzyme [Oscillospiraceae bacterium]|nr:pyridoxal-phosphate dependent enzyme [Oscillospiraceae bacterium]
MKQINPVTPILSLGSLEGNTVSVKRDDLLPFSFGGNKVRIAQEYFADMEQRGCDCLIGYGNARSNLCRVLSNMSAAKGIPCVIISPNDDDNTRTPTMNSSMVQMCNAKIVVCDKSDVAKTVQRVIDECKAAGYNPYYIYGDCFGKGNEATPVRAYASAFREIQDQVAAGCCEYDMIFLPTGTGMTQAGLLAGAAEAGMKQTVIGISVARAAEQEKQVLERFLAAYFAETGIRDTVQNEILVTDAYLCGGYGKFDGGIRSVIETVYRQYGMQLDPTYSGKGFFGMLSYLREHAVTGKKILFLHTGGTPLYFELLMKYYFEGSTEHV